MIERFVQRLATLSDHFICMYGCGFTGTYDEVDAHQRNCPNR